MQYGNWVCLGCRTSRRRPHWRYATYFRPEVFGSRAHDTVLCHSCRKPCRYIGDRVEVPAQRDDQGWKQLRQFIQERKQWYREWKAQSDTRQKHKLERRIQALQRRPANQERDRLINELREELRKLAAC